MKDKQGIIFIIVGSLGLVISLYFLVLAFFENPNTDEEIQNQTGQQENVFNQIETGDIVNINLLMPEFLFSSGFENIDKNMNISGMDINFYFYDKFEYLEILSGWQFSGNTMDIILMSTNFLSSLKEELLYIEMIDSITGYYHPSFYNYLDNEYTFIPHSIDPILVYGQEGITDISEELGFSDFIDSRKARTRFHFPIVIPVGDKELNLLEQGKELISDQFFIIDYLVKYIQEIDQTKQSYRKNIISKQNEPLWILSDYLQIISRLSNNNDKCKKYPDLCLFFYKFLDYRIGFLSDIDRLDMYFGNIEFETYPIWNNGKYPGKGFGFVANKNSQDIEKIARFFEKYMINSLVELDSSLWKNTIPAGISSNNQYKINDKSSFLKEYVTEFYLVE